uniref:Uncharacterized protein n=1 Tax=Anguilla anguilla TaxID=7936 RepID=A0A0E9PN31_ANGAN
MGQCRVFQCSAITKMHSQIQS